MNRKTPDLVLVVAAVWGSNNEQYPLPIGVFGPCLRSGINMGFLSRSAGNRYRMYCHGYLWQLPHYFPSLGIFIGFRALSILYCSGVCSGLCFRLVIDLEQIKGCSSAYLIISWLFFPFSLIV